MAGVIAKVHGETGNQDKIDLVLSSLPRLAL